jgi:hypothetical protein
MVPTGMTTPIALKEEMEAIDVALIGGARSFVVSGFYSSIVAEFTDPLTTGTVTIAIISNGNHLAALPTDATAPSTTIITEDWNGVDIVGKSTPGHGELSLHHIAVACAGTPSTGSLSIYGRPTGATGRVSIGGPFDLTKTGTATIVVAGFFDEFYLVAEDTISGAIPISARVASAGVDLNLLPVIDSQLDTLVADINASLILKKNDRVVAAAAVPVASQAIANATTQKVTLGAQQLDYGAFFDPATSKFVPSIEGLYQFTVLVEYGRNPGAAATAGKRTMAMVYKNGVNFKQASSATHDSSSGSTCELSGFAVANGITDYFELYARHESGHADMEVVTRSKMEMFRIGSAAEVEMIEMFAESDYGWWFTAGDFGRDMFELSTGTGQVDALDDPIGLWMDKSGNEHNLLQTTAGNRPLLKQDGGTFGTGLYFALYDGTNDGLATV